MDGRFILHPPWLGLLGGAMNAAHRFLADRRARRPQSAEQGVRDAIAAGRQSMEAYAFCFSPCDASSAELARPASTYSPVELYARGISSPELVLPRARPRPASASAVTREPPALPKRGASGYLSDGRARRRPASAAGTRKMRATFAPAEAAEAAATAMGPSDPATASAPSPPLNRTWSWSTSLLMPVATPPKPATSKPVPPRPWTLDGSLILEARDAEAAAAAEAARRAALVHPRHMAPAARTAHVAARARRRAVHGPRGTVHAYGSWHNHSTWDGPTCHRDGWMYLRPRENSRVAGVRLGPPA